MIAIRASWAVALALMLAMGIAPAPASELPPGNAIRVRLAQGELAGLRQDGVRAFLGIPYAAAPVGERRWRAPQAAQPWRGLRDGTRFGPGCMQPHPEPFGAWTAEFIAGPQLSEDCLTLNVWAPARRVGGLPVLVWIHGGAFSGGSGAVAVYNGASLARRGAVVVTVNYRLGVFGFLAHPALSAESPRHVSGNYGLLDMIEALRWVRANIERFGGDPKRVTIAGQSAGAAAVNDLIVSPEARGLFARGIAQSGSGMGIPIRTLAEAEQQGEAMQRAASLESLSALRALPAAQLLELRVPPAPGTTPDAGLQLPFAPVLDGAVLPADAGRGDAPVASPVPLLTGYNADESLSMGPSPVTAVEFDTQVRARYGAFAERLLTLYPHSNDTEANESSLLLARDRYMVSLIVWSLKRTATSPQPIYAYLFSHTLPGPDAARFRSFHTAEVPYIFGVLDQGGRTFGATDRTVSQLMQDYWLEFMRNGAPAVAALPTWPKFNATSGKIMGLDVRPELIWPASSGERYQALRDYAAAGGALSLF